MTKFDFYPVEKGRRFEEYAETYKFDQTEPTPWSPLKKPLRDSKVVLITTAGVSPREQPPFKLTEKGCFEYREIPLHTPRKDLVFFHPDFSADEAKKDINVILPIDRFIELVEERIIGELCDVFFSFLGIFNDLWELEGAMTAFTYKLKGLNIDSAFIFPGGFRCTEAVGFISRFLERSGISTVAIVLIKEVAEQIKIPRALFINFPFGTPLGKAHIQSLQNSIVNDMVSALKTLDRPGKIINLPYKWEESLK
jgi:glycine/betaine/sarcosine/D-proline reductase family selenoprotein B